MWESGKYVASVIAWNEFEQATGISEDDVENYIFSWGDVVYQDYQYVSNQTQAAYNATAATVN